MSRCEDFYRKYGREGNFCEKHTRTVERIDAYVGLLPEIEDAVANNEVLRDTSATMGDIITERASRALVSLKGTEPRQKAIQQVVKRLEQKKLDGKRIRVTTPEVEEIVQQIEPRTKRTTQASEDGFDKAKNLLAIALDEVPSKPEAIDELLARIDELSRILQSKRKALEARKAVCELAIAREAESASVSSEMNKVYGESLLLDVDSNA
jgi:seryl-tRNA synthetase